MRLGLRWFGPGEDRIPLEYLRQIPVLTTVVTALHHIPAGDAWPAEEIAQRRDLIERHGLDLDTIESVNVHEDIKLGLPSRDAWIEKYILTLERLGAAGVKTVCYNFMPVFDWTRTDLAHRLRDGSTTLAYHHEKVRDAGPEKLLEAILSETRDFEWPGWEADRLEELKNVLEQYRGFDEERLWSHLEYFLDAVAPAAEKADVRLAIHPDDPPWPIFGIPRIITGAPAYRRLLSCCKSPANGLAFCTGSLGASPKNDLPAMIKEFGNRIYFAHLRNVSRNESNDFQETAHPSTEGSLDMYAILTALYDAKYEGVVRPDHGRMIWGETGRPGYGLYDRALGLTYFAGMWEGIVQSRRFGKASLRSFRRASR